MSLLIFCISEDKGVISWSGTVKDEKNTLAKLMIIFETTNNFNENFKKKIVKINFWLIYPLY